MPTITRGAVAATSLVGADNLAAQLDALRHAPGFLGGAVHRAVDDPGKTFTYVGWSDPAAAVAALGSGGDGPPAHVLSKVVDVRLTAAPEDHNGRMRVRDDGPVVLVVRIDVDPARSDEALGELNMATDGFLPAFDAVLGVTFHRSPDGAQIVEYLQVESPEAMQAIQARPDMQAHEERLKRMVRSLDAGVYRVERIVPAPAATAANAPSLA